MTPADNCRTLPQRLYRRVMELRAAPLGEQSLAASAVVFSPHPDDETLACGGTIIRKLAAGARVRIVFFTDGSRSHAKYMPPAQLKQLRAAEALAAAQMLGVAREDVLFLECPDGELLARQEQYLPRVTELLASFQPAQVLVPYRHETPRDHAAANRIVSVALRASAQPVEVLEYPVWSWCHWPWVPLSPNRRDKLRDLLAAPRQALRTCRNLRTFVPVQDALEQKLRALEQYKTQMTRLAPSWPVLADVHNGQFLAALLGDQEWFHSSSPDKSLRSDEAFPRG